MPKPLVFTTSLNGWCRTKPKLVPILTTAKNRVSRRTSRNFDGGSAPRRGLKGGGKLLNFVRLSDIASAASRSPAVSAIASRAEKHRHCRCPPYVMFLIGQFSLIESPPCEGPRE